MTRLGYPGAQGDDWGATVTTQLSRNSVALRLGQADVEIPHPDPPIPATVLAEHATFARSGNGRS